jgi:photosystem II stability/assembly factor-like uncharacterized protein
MTRRRIAALLVGVAGGLVFAASGFASAPSRAVAGAAFQPFTASFVSPSTGFVLGGVGCAWGQDVAPARPCRAVIEETVDGGASWRQLPAPGPMLEWFHGIPSSSVSAITFANLRDGWIYDGALWSTHDGGAHWSQIGLKLQITAVVAAGAWAYAATTGENTLVTGSIPAVLRSPIGRDDWQPVRSLPSMAADAYPSLLAASGSTVFVAVRTTTPTAWRTAGARWQRLPNPCSFVVALDASAPQDLIAFCLPTLAISTDGGTHTTTARAPPKSFTTVLGVPNGQTQVILLAAPPPSVGPNTNNTPYAISRTTDAGQDWTQTRYGDSAADYSDLQFPSANVGWVIHGFPGSPSDQLLRTTDAGATFNAVRF